MKEVVNESKSSVRVKGVVGEKFWAAKGVRQRSPVSPMLFNILMANVEEVMGRVKWRK